MVDKAPEEPTPTPPGSVESSEPESILARISKLSGTEPKVLLRDPDSRHDAVVKPAPPEVMRSSDEERYRILGEIARGGVGVVLKSHDGDLGRHVAMKVLLDHHLDNPQIVERFVEEAQIGGQLQHPGIVPVYELGMRPDARPYFTMKLIKGETLSALLKERKDVDRSRRRLLTVFEAVCQTLAYAHSRGVVHRDLKPSNVMVGAFGEVQVVDWGLAKVLAQGGIADEEPQQRSPARTEISVIETLRTKPGSTGSDSIAGSVMGTPAYMAPEQAMGQVESVDERADVFALGAILLEILTGRGPYAGSPEEVLLAAANARLDPAFEMLEDSNVDAELKEICRTCLAPPRSVRFRNGQAVAEHIGAYLASVEKRAREAQIAAAEARVKAEDERRARRLTLGLGLAVVLALVVAGAGYWVFEQQRLDRARATQTAVNQALDEAHKLRAKARGGGSGEVAAWDAAILAARRAEQVVQTEEVDDETRTRVASVLEELQGERRLASFRISDRQDDLDFLERFVRIRMSHGFEAQRWQRLLELYEDAFALYGIEVEDPEDAVSVIRDSQIPLELASALDDWAFVERRVAGLESEYAKVLLGIALEADSDPWRQRLRQAAMDLDLGDLQELAQSSQAQAASAEMLTTLSKALWEVQDVEGCIRILNATKPRFPSDYLVNLYLAQALAVQGRPAAEVLRYAEVARSSEPSSLEAQNLVASMLWRLERHDEATALWQEATKSHPESARMHSQLSAALSERGAVDEAMAAAEVAVRLDEEDPVHHQRLSEALYAAGEYRLAAVRAEEAIRLSPEGAGFHLTHGRAVLRAGDLNQALISLREAQRLDPSVEDLGDAIGEALRRQAQVLLSQGGQNLEARDLLLESASWNPDDWEVHRLIGTVASWTMDREAWIASLQKYLELRPDDPDAISALAYQLGARHPEESLALFRRALALEPDDPLNHFDYARTLQRAEQFDLATEHYREALRLSPDHSTITARLASLAEGRGRYEEAAAIARRRMEVAPQDPEVPARLGYFLYGSREYSESRRALEEALRKQPQSSEAHRYLGMTLLELGEFDEALSHFRRSVQLSDYRVNVLRHLDGLLCIDGWRVASAIETCERRAVEAAEDPWAHYELGLMLLVADRHEEAVESFDAALDLRSVPVFRYFRILSLMMAEEIEEGIQAAEEFLQDLGPGASGYFYTLSGYVRMAGKVDAAARVLELVIELDQNDPGLWQAYGIASLLRDDLEAAADAFSAAVALSPGEFRWHHLLGECLLAMGRERQAQECFDESDRLSIGGGEEPAKRARRLLSRREYNQAYRASLQAPELNVQMRTVQIFLRCMSPFPIDRGSFDTRRSMVELLRLAPEDPWVWTAKALVLLRSREVERCRGALRQATTLAGGESPAVCLIHALLSDELGERSAAFDWFLRGANQHDLNHPAPFEAITELIQAEVAERLRG